MEYTVETLENAVKLFYRTGAHQQAKAHQWLQDAQNSQEAWRFVWELLSPQKSSEVQFFAATTLHTKLMKSWDEVPADHYEFLKKRIIDAIVTYANGPKLVLNRLCIALSAYVIHTIPNYWPKAFEELITGFQPQYFPNVDPERVIWILLEILTVIPEEFQTTTLTMSHRTRVHNTLQSISRDIMTVVSMCLEPLPSAGFMMGNLTIYLNAARCAAAWIQLGALCIEECTRVINLLIDLICFVYWNRTEPECLNVDEMDLIEVAVEALTAVIQHPHTNRYKNSVLKFAAQIFHKFNKILDIEGNQQDMNKDLVGILYGLIISMGTAQSVVFVNNMSNQDLEERKISFDLLTSILKCSNLPGLYPVDESCSTYSFAFWYTIQDDIIALETAHCASLLLMIKPYYRDLVCIMLRKSMYPLTDDNWSLDDQDVFRCYRQDIADTLMYCYIVLNLEMLDILNTKLDEALRKTDENGHNRPLRWNEVEAVLHAYGALAESVECENLYVPKLMSKIKEIPFEELHVRVMATALDTVGEYSEWFMDHPNLLESIFPLILTSLGNADVAVSATIALKDLTSYCQNFLSPFAEHILLATQNILTNGTLKLAEQRRLMYIIGHVLSTLPVDKIMSYLNVILAPSLEELQEMIKAEPSPSINDCLMTRLKLLSALYSTLYVEPTKISKGDQPVFIVMQKTMPLFQVIGEKYRTNQAVIEDVSAVLKCGITTLKEDCRPLVHDILQFIVTVYRECPQTSMLAVAKILLILFGNDDEFTDVNHQLLREIIMTTLQMCSQYSTSNQLSEKSEVLEGFFSMLAALTKKVPALIAGCGVDASTLFQCGILCLIVPEIPTLKAVSHFLVQYITQSRETSQSNVVQTYGESLVLQIMMNLGSTAPRSSIDIFSDIILALNKKYCDNLCRWLNTLLAQEGFPSPRISTRQKEAFIKCILREKANKRKLADCVLEFTLICRGILKPDSD